MNRRQEVYFGGIPTDPDIKQIREAFPEDQLNALDEIPYEDIENLLGIPQTSSRFRAVTNRWRKIVEDETGLVIGVIRGKGFKLLNDEEKLDLSVGKLRTAVRQSHKSYRYASLVDAKALNEENKKRLDHITSRSAKVIAAAQVRTAIEKPEL